MKTSVIYFDNGGKNAVIVKRIVDMFLAVEKKMKHSHKKIIK